MLPHTALIKYKLSMLRVCVLTAHFTVLAVDPACVCICVSYPSFWPVELFKNILEVLHGSVCYQHDGLVTQAALAQCCNLNTHTMYLILDICTVEIS